MFGMSDFAVGDLAEVVRHNDNMKYHGMRQGTVHRVTSISPCGYYLRFGHSEAGWENTRFKKLMKPETLTTPSSDKHSHYHKPCPYETIDVYRVLELFEVTDPCLQHAIKKLLVAGGRGHKSTDKDVGEAIDTLNRWKQMRAEDDSL